MTIEIICSDALTALRTLPSEHFHCCITSPPYWGLRMYLKDGEPGKEHEIGLEESPSEWCARLVEVFREVRRVLRSDGVCLVNVGDGYCADGRKGRDFMGEGKNSAYNTWVNRTGPGLKPKDLIGAPWMLAFALRADGWWLRGDYIWAKPNPMPESVRDRCTKAHEMVFHLTKSGESQFWVHRDKPGSRTRPAPDYRWRHKETGEEVAEPPPDPENWRRFNLWAGWDYFWDAEAVREKDAGLPSGNGFAGRQGDARTTAINGGHGSLERFEPGAGRNLRSVWTIATDPLPSIEVDGEKLDHFASFPVELARRAILAGTSAKGCCPAMIKKLEDVDVECGAPWARVFEPGKPLVNGERNRGGRVDGFTTPKGGAAEWAEHVPPTTTGWRPTCSCKEDTSGAPIGGPWRPQHCRVLDPFGGSGRTALAAEELGRDCTLIELSEASCRMAQAQLERAKARRMIGDVERRTTPEEGQMTLFEVLAP